MALDNNIIESKLGEKFKESVANFHVVQDMLVFEVLPANVKELIAFMKKDETLNFVFLTDICGVHYPDNEKDQQFAVVYHLHNWVDNVRVRIKTYLNGDQPVVDTVSDVFASANWMERETFDFYGVKFIGHPNLKKILNDEGMTSFPMRKEFPMEDSERTDKDDRFFGRLPNNNQQKQSK